MNLTSVNNIEIKAGNKVVYQCYDERKPMLQSGIVESVESKGICITNDVTNITYRMTNLYISRLVYVIQ